MERPKNMNNTDMQECTKEQSKPAVCCVAITKGCMFKCKMCYMWKENMPNRQYTQVDIVYWEKFIAAMKDFVSPLTINFVGGESLTSEATLDLIKYASNLSCETVLTSNAYLIDEKMAENLAGSGLKEIYLSLDSIKEETHDFLRGVRGSFRKVNSAIGYLNKYAKDIKIRINTIITEVNLEEVIDLARWVIKDSRIESISFIAVTRPFDTNLDDYWYEKKEYSFLWPKEPDKVDRIIDELMKLKEQNARKILNLAPQFSVFKSYFRDPRSCFKQSGCLIYKKILNISSNGQINMCFYMDPIGNIKQDEINLRELWDSSLAGQVRDNIRNCGRNCHFRVNCYLGE